MNPLVVAGIGFATASIVVLALLIFIYGKMALKTHSRYSLGLVGFSSLLLGQSVALDYMCSFMTEYYSSPLNPVLAVLAASEFAGLIVLFLVTL